MESFSLRSMFDLRQQVTRGKLFLDGNLKFRLHLVHCCDDHVHDFPSERPQNKTCISDCVWSISCCIFKLTLTLIADTHNWNNVSIFTITLSLYLKPQNDRSKRWMTVISKFWVRQHLFRYATKSWYALIWLYCRLKGYKTLVLESCVRWKKFKSRVVGLLEKWTSWLQISSMRHCIANSSILASISLHTVFVLLVKKSSVCCLIWQRWATELRGKMPFSTLNLELT